MELSGATTANWVAKTANLLVDGLGSPERVGLLLPLHWQSVAVLLAGVATGAQVVLANGPSELAGCGAAFVAEAYADVALDAGADEVLVLSGHPLGAPTAVVPALATDFAREVPSYADHWGGPVPAGWHVEVGGRAVAALPAVDVGPDDRVLLAVTLSDPTGLGLLLAVLGSGAALVLTPDPSGLDLVAVADEERLTACAGVDVPGLARLPGSGPAR